MDTQRAGNLICVWSRSREIVISLKSAMRMLKTISPLRTFSHLLKSASLAVVAITSATSGVAVSAQVSRPSINVGGYTVTLGMALEDVRRTLGSVYQIRLADSESWMIQQGENRIARIFHSNGTVFAVIKHYDKTGMFSSATDYQMRELAEATADFAQLASPYYCEVPRPSSPLPGNEQSGIRISCGPYSLDLITFKTRGGDLSTIVYVGLRE